MSTSFKALESNDLQVTKVFSSYSKFDLQHLFVVVKIESPLNETLEMVKYIFENIDNENISTEEDEFGITAFGYACKNGHLEVAKYLLNKLDFCKKELINSGSSSPLWLASNNGQEKIVQFLLQCDIEIGKKALDGTTPIIMAISKGHFGILDLFAEIWKKSFVFQEYSKFGKWEYLSSKNFGNLQFEQHDIEMALESSVKSGCHKTVKQVLSICQVYSRSMNHNADLIHDSHIRNELGLPNEPKTSELVELSKKFPVFNEYIEDRVIPTKKMYNSLSYSIFADLKPLILGTFCPIEKHVERMKKSTVNNGNLLTLKNMVISSTCQEYCTKQRECLIINDLLSAAQALELQLSKSDDSTQPTLMSALRPRFLLIGSVAEGTRLKTASEMDVSVQFEVFKDDAFTVGNDATQLFVPGIPCMKEFQINESSGVFDYPKFLAFFLQEVHAALEAIEKTLPEHIKINVNFEACENCKNYRKKKSIYEPFAHCIDCLPAVTHTKLGPCLIFQWNDGSLDSPLITTVDMVPIFPVKGKTVLELYNIVMRTLVENQPPGWLQYFNNLQKGDIILPEHFKSQMLNIRDTSTIDVAIKLLNYGPEKNYIIRPAQEMTIQDFETTPKLKTVYMYIKALKALLDINDVKSYFLKKILLLPYFKAKANDPNIKMEELLFETLSHRELRRVFEKNIRYDEWKQTIDQLKKEGRDAVPNIPFKNSCH